MRRVKSVYNPITAPTQMQTTILSLSQDEGLTSTRALILQAAGYRAVTVNNLSDATRLAIGCEVAIIDQTFTLDQQRDFVGRDDGDRTDEDVRWCRDEGTDTTAGPDMNIQRPNVVLSEDARKQLQQRLGLRH